MTDPYASETADETHQRRLDDFAAWQAERARAEMLATSTAATLRALLTEHVADEPSISPRYHLTGWEHRVAKQHHDDWRQELDTLARAYVAALDREAAQLPLRLARVAQ